MRESGSGGIPVAECAVWRRVAGVGAEPLDLFDARFKRGHFTMHSHDEYSIGVCLDGVELIRHRGQLHRLGPGTVVVIEPGEPHTGGPADAAGFAYRVMYPAIGMFANETPHFADLIQYDPQLAEQFRVAHESLSRGDDRIEAESRLTAALAELVARHAKTAPPAQPRIGGRTARLVMARLEDQIVAPPTLTDIADDLGLSRFQVVRGFRDTVGMPPYAWLAQRRVAKARVLLAGGARPSEAAARVGFADQAHMTRWFRRVIGVTPGTYRNSVQDSHGSRC
ncbi:helix-turn-helix transcriptional regulator [Fodinicola acaciae]|uniref:helix-turn-helix transcriptional regulator n=1 Tax=Fodinicola acaciae TaxID=2681555 RepID=UPI001C9E40B7|nr:AraC family transcriptional regulator [Fodinicola acaciae]